MYNQKVSACIIGVLALLLLIVTVPPARAQFVVASWEYPDDYGQYIEAFSVYENSTGAWVYVDSTFPDESGIYDWEVGAHIKLYCHTWFNSTLTGAVSKVDGQKYQRHDVNVTMLGESVFSQQNFTYEAADSGINPPMWYYTYSVILGFTPISGGYYTVTVTYEIFW